MLAEIVSGTLTTAITAVGKWLITEASLPHSRLFTEDAEISRWFDTYRLTSEPSLPEVADEGDAIELAAVLQSNEIQAQLHDLLAARLTNAPESQIETIRGKFLHGFAQLSFTQDTAQFREEAFAYFDGEVCDLVGRLQGAQPQLYSELQGAAYNARVVSLLNSIEAYAATLADNLSPNDEAEYLEKYRRHVKETHGYLEPPDFERRYRIPIESIYVAPTIMQVKSDREKVLKDEAVPLKDESSPVSLTQLADCKRAVLLGDPGGGKSTVSNVLLHDQANDASGDLVPFLVLLREFAGDASPSQSIAAYIEHRLETVYQCPPPPRLVNRLLLSGRTLVIFDGLDEVLDIDRRVQTARIIENFCVEYPDVAVLVTSRTVGYEQARLDRQFTRFRLAKFDVAQVTEYVKKWFSWDDAVPEPEAEAMAVSFIDESRSVPDLRSNPLMLALMCILYRGEGSIPQNRPQVYEACAELLFRKWDARRRIKVQLRAHHLLDAILRHLAYRMLESGAREPAISHTKLVEEISAFLLERGFEPHEKAVEAADEFARFCEGRAWVFTDTGSSGDGETLYAFTHRTFFEYFAAAHLAINSDTPEGLARVLLPHIAQVDLEIIPEIALQKKDKISDRGAERVVTYLLAASKGLSSSERGNVLVFVAGCLRSVKLGATVTREISRAILAHTYSGEPNGPTYYEPLRILLLADSDSLPVIRDEICNRISSMIGSGERKDREDGLYLATSLNLRASGDDFGNSGFWHETWLHLCNNYRDVIITGSRNNNSLRYVALHLGFRDMGDVLAQTSGRLSVLMTEPSTGIFGLLRRAYLLDRTEEFCATWPAVNELVIRDFTAIGNWISTQSPPWITVGPVPRRSARVMRTFQGGAPVNLPGLSYAGLIACLCVWIEIDPSVSRLIPIQELTPGFFEYAEARLSGLLPRDPSKLAVPDELSTLFAAWAKNEVNFVHVRGHLF